MNPLASFPLHAPAQECDTGLRLSVIVPFGPQETEGAVLLDQLRALPWDAEIVLVRVDGYPLPRALSNAEDRDTAHIHLSPPGRARQLNVGAQAARGRWLWFLHADSHLHPRTLPALDAFLAKPEAAVGYFDLRYRGDGPAMAQLNALGANWRARWLKLPFGDQGLVLPAAWFAKLGGYDEHAENGEDHLLVWHARHAGLPLRRLGAPLTSSARKYAEQGWWRTSRRHLWLTLKQAWPEWRALRRARQPGAMSATSEGCPQPPP
jgi:hypothetical protein